MTDQARYPQIMRLCSETPWAIRAEKLVAIREMLALRASGERFSSEEIAARIGAGPAQKQATTTSTVAIIPIYGVITPKADLMSEMSGGTSVQALSSALRAAVADPSINSILLDVDSPGGMTDLVPEFAAEIRQARGSKPIVAIANTDAASAAYWLASQAGEFVVTPSGMVGSIGVFAAHEDLSAQQEQDGVKTTLISAGKFKVESNPFQPLSEDARGAIQSRVDAFYGMFTRDVAKGRGVTVEEARSGFGEGRIVTAQEALKAGMVDRVASFEATVERMISEASGVGKKSVSMAISSANVSSANTLYSTGFATTASSQSTSAPPGEADDTSITQGADGALSFAHSAAAVRDAADKLTADAGSLRVLTAAKRDALSLVAESLKGSAAALAELVAQSEAPTGADVLERWLMADAERRHFKTTGVPT